jgi:hypothetical protein
LRQKVKLFIMLPTISIQILDKGKVTRWNYKVCAGFENLEKESVTGPLASSPRWPTSACPDRLKRTRAATSSPRSPRVATPPRHLLPSPRAGHAVPPPRAPHSILAALIHCELHTEGLYFSLHPFRAASSLCSPLTRAQPPSTELYRCATPSSCATNTPSTFQPLADPPCRRSRDTEEVPPEPCRCHRESPRRQPAPVLLRPHLLYPEHRSNTGHLPSPTLYRQ